MDEGAVKAGGKLIFPLVVTERSPEKSHAFRHSPPLVDTDGKPRRSGRFRAIAEVADLD